MDDFKNDIQEIEEKLTKLYDEVVTHEAEAVIGILLDKLNNATDLYKNKIETEMSERRI